MIVTVRVVEDLARRLRARADRIGATAAARAARSVAALAAERELAIRSPGTGTAAVPVDAAGPRESALPGEV